MTNNLEWFPKLLKAIESVHPKSPRSTPPPSDFFHIYTIHRCIKSRKILQISGQNTYENYFYMYLEIATFTFLDSWKFHVLILNFHSSYKILKSIHPNYQIIPMYIDFYPRILKIMLKTLKNTGIMLLMTPELAISRK